MPYFSQWRQGKAMFFHLLFEYGPLEVRPRLLESPTLSPWLIDTAPEQEWGAAPEEEAEAQEVNRKVTEAAQTTAAESSETQEVSRKVNRNPTREIPQKPT
jgi:hypothetical protein